MSRQINNEIFNEGFTPKENNNFMPLDVQTIDPNYEEMTRKLEKVRFEVQEWMSSFNLRLEKNAQKSQGLEEKLKTATMESHNRMASLYSRFKETQNNDLKFTSLVERHNNIVQSFELRLTQSQRLIENQALQLAKQQELIDDARRQLEKLKKI
jgi:hypothetical protein